MKRYLLILLVGFLTGSMCFAACHTDKMETDNRQAVEKTEQIETEDKTAAYLQQIGRIDFSANTPHLDITQDEDVAYKKAYLRILKDEIPVETAIGDLQSENANQTENFYSDLWKAGIPYEELYAEKTQRKFPYLYYYDDLDGDGKPELAVNQGCFYIIQYDLEKDASQILYSQQSCYLGSIVGTGQIWYHDGLHGDVVRDKLIVWNEDSKWEEILDLERGNDQERPFYIVRTGDSERLEVEVNSWNKATAPFFALVENNRLSQMTLEEVFGELLEE